MFPFLSKKAVILLLLSLVTLTAAATEPVRPSCPSSRHPRTYTHRPSSITHHPSPITHHRSIYQGERRQLVYLVAFSDQKFKEEDPMALWEKVFNQPDFVEGDYVGSVHDYFRDQSYGQLLLQFDLIYMEMDERAKYRSGYIGNVADDSGAGLLLTELLDKTKEAVGDWSVYDWDDDGYVDQVIILFAGKGQNDGGGSNSIWSNQWRLSEQSQDPFNREWGYPYEVAEGLLVDSYGVFPELTGKGTYGTFGTICHEYGHCLSLPDFYYGGSTQVVGAWDIMDCGNYSMGGFCPPGYSAHERMYLGWLDVTELTDPVSVSGMDAVNGEQPQAYLIRNDGYDNEYYVIENRQQTGWDKSLPGSGLLVFHIDYDEEVWKVGVPNSSSYKRYTIIPANNSSGVGSSAKWAYPYMASGFVINNELTNTSKPAATLLHANSDGTKLMSKPITNMKVENGLASFDFMGGMPSGIIQHSSFITPQTLYQYGPLRIVRSADGVVRKILKP